MAINLEAIGQGLQRNMAESMQGQCGLADYFLTTPRLGFRHWHSNDSFLAHSLWGTSKVAALTVRGRWGPLDKSEGVVKAHFTVAVPRPTPHRCRFVLIIRRLRSSRFGKDYCPKHSLSLPELRR
jgi:hypothetical protein